ncbi:MAG TPA: NAD(P)H-hydrate dehydratase [Acholeplasmataceae bacterium]|jgi:NAD(P)H-hydrate epimerase|nr:NAD(P)H-hydrate dehydratase [Acholeplasmataceae bacterium]
MNVITVEEVRKIDKKTLESISEENLITKVGEKLFETLIEIFNLSFDEKIVIIAGPGNNGADSLALGLHLIKYNPVIICFNRNKYFTQKLEKEKANLLYDFNYKTLEKVISKATLIIDGLFGTGLNKDVSGLFYDIIKLVNKAQAFVFSIDIPSGINGDNGLVCGAAVKANFTAIIEYYKVGNLVNDALDYHGVSKVIKVGLEKPDSNRFLLPIPKLEKRKYNSHKYDYGSVLFIGGKMIGATVMASLAALRSGSGLVSLLSESKSIASWEIITFNNNEFDKALAKKDAICFGPGLGLNDDSNLEVLEKIYSYPLVIDADGLYYLKKLDKPNPNIVITPHFGEVAKLLDTIVEKITKAPLESIKEVTNKYKCTVVLKGPCTIIAFGNEIYFSPFGNPGMATAGSGDVLSGIITSFLGRGLSPLESAKRGVYIHSLAGKIAKEKYGEESLIATDIINALPEAFQEINKFRR